MKICPYVQYRHKQIQKNIYNEENPGIIERYEIENYYDNAGCVEEKCGVFYDGKCHFRE